MSEFEVRVETSPVRVVVEPEQVTVLTQAEPPAVQIIGGIQGAPGTSSGLAYRRSFTDGDLTTGNLLLVTHNLGNAVPLSVIVYNGSGAPIFPDNIEVLGANVISINFESYRPLQGTYQLAIGA